MPTIETKYFGTMPFDEVSCFDFPYGLPAFEDERGFVIIETTAHKPLLFLQSVTTPALCFIALPVLLADPHYKLAMNAGDLAALQLPPGAQSRIGVDVLVFTLLSIQSDAPATANLLAPVVINLANRKALQAIRNDAVYSHAQPLGARAEEYAC